MTRNLLLLIVIAYFILVAILFIVDPRQDPWLSTVNSGNPVPGETINNPNNN